MKNKLIALAIGLFALAGSSQLVAQEATDKGTIPFDFEVGSRHLAAGNYAVGRSGAGHSLAIRNTTTGRSILTPMPIPQGANRRNEAKLVFRKYGDHYFLAEVWFVDDPIIQRMSVSKLEREYALEVHVGKPRIVYLAMR